MAFLFDSKAPVSIALFSYVRIVYKKITRNTIPGQTNVTQKPN